MAIIMPVFGSKDAKEGAIAFAEEAAAELDGQLGAVYDQCPRIVGVQRQPARPARVVGVVAELADPATGAHGGQPQPVLDRHPDGAVQRRR